MPADIYTKISNLMLSSTVSQAFFCKTSLNLGNNTCYKQMFGFYEYIQLGSTCMSKLDKNLFPFTSNASNSAHEGPGN